MTNEQSNVETSSEVKPRNYGILSLSGGGVRGIFQAVFLHCIAKQLPEKPFYDHFQLIAGTSTGAIVAAGVAFGIDLARIVELFTHRGQTIFSPRRLSILRRGPRYSNLALREALTNVFGSKRMYEAEKPLFICATTLDSFKARIIATNSEDTHAPVVDAILASCAAPTYFPSVRIEPHHRSYVDGGLWANNPSLAAVMSLDEQFRKSRAWVLQVGNGTPVQGILPGTYNKLSPISPKMVAAILDMMFAAQSSVAYQHCRNILGDEHILSIDTNLRKYIAVDDVVSAIEILPPLAEEEARKNFKDVKKLFSTGRVLRPSQDYFHSVSDSPDEFHLGA
jgi:predicted acylesterase/phospholipase RssA